MAKSKPTMNELLERLIMATETHDAKLQTKLKKDIAKLAASPEASETPKAGKGKVVKKSSAAEALDMAEDEWESTGSHLTKKANTKKKSTHKKITTSSPLSADEVSQVSRPVRVVDEYNEADFVKPRKSSTTKKSKGEAKPNLFVDNGDSFTIAGEKRKDAMPVSHKKATQKLDAKEVPKEYRDTPTLISAVCIGCGVQDNDLDPYVVESYDENGRRVKRGYRCNDCIKSVR